MAHKSKSAVQVRVWVEKSTIRDVKLAALLLGHDDWNIVLDQIINLGLGYLNDFGHLELDGWTGKLGLKSLRNLEQTLVPGDLLALEEN